MKGVSSQLSEDGRTGSGWRPARESRESPTAGGVFRVCENQDLYSGNLMTVQSLRGEFDGTHRLPFSRRD